MKQKRMTEGKVKINVAKEKLCLIKNNLHFLLRTTTSFLKIVVKI